ncbi:hypothetical protein [Desulforamulus ruminis]|uniref:hypothetical protein n=1 Tax=Desulforamulus ruminis TaxID=1564 RepID=UPI00117FE9F2|nr:hypothetical protein [Desulforamulus ruminis]
MILLEKLCILCNRLYKLEINCPACGRSLQDLGVVQDFYDPYSPYEDQRIYQDGYRGYTEDCCVHMLYCSDCGWQEFRPIKRLLESLLLAPDHLQP